MPAIEQFRYYILGSTSAECNITRDRWGNYQSKETSLINIDDDDVPPPLEDVGDAKPVPSLSARKLQMIGKAVMEGCHKPGASVDSKNSVLQLLVGKVTGTTAGTCV